MTVRWTVRAATDRGPQSESRVLFEAPTKGTIQLDGSFFTLISLFEYKTLCILTVIRAERRIGYIFCVVIRKCQTPRTIIFDICLFCCIIYYNI